MIITYITFFNIYYVYYVLRRQSYERQSYERQSLLIIQKENNLIYECQKYNMKSLGLNRIFYLERNAKLLLDYIQSCYIYLHEIKLNYRKISPILSSIKLSSEIENIRRLFNSSNNLFKG